MKTRNNIILTFLGIGIFAYVIYTVGINEVLDILSKVSIKDLFIVFLFFSLSQLIRIGKWQIMCGAVSLKVKKLELSKFYFYTRLMGIVTPFRSGEVVPSFFEGENKNKFFSLTIADRFYESLTTLIVIMMALAFLFSDLFGRDAWLVIGLMILVLVIFYLIFTVENFYLFFKSVISFSRGKNKPMRLRKKFIVFLDDIYLSIKKVLGVRLSVILFLITIVATSIDVMMFKYIFLAAGINIGLIESAVAFSFLMLINFVSPTPSGIGIGDAGYIALGTRMGVGTQAQIGSFLIVARVYIVLLSLLYVLLFNVIGRLKK